MKRLVFADLKAVRIKLDEPLPVVEVPIVQDSLF
jgi:hypothetical protein